jgi:Ser/Thr protein kinase RdoA (MazF antagonist)
MRFVAAGRTAEVFEWDKGQVVKLDRPEWNGLSHYEAGVLERLAAAGVAVPAVFGTVTVDGRAGAVLAYLEGPSPAALVRSGAVPVEQVAADFADFHQAIHRPIGDLPDLVDLVRANIDRAPLADPVKEELLVLLADVDRGERVLCHGDLNAENVIITADGPVAIDWLTAASGPPAADLARTLVLLGWPSPSDPAMDRFVATVARRGAELRGLDRPELLAWIRVMAAARLDEGFTGAAADRLVTLAVGVIGGE